MLLSNYTYKLFNSTYVPICIHLPTYLLGIYTLCTYLPIMYIPIYLIIKYLHTYTLIFIYPVVT